MKLQMLVAAATLVVSASAERPVDPTFLYRNLETVTPVHSEMTTGTASYKPLFGEGDSVTSIVKGLARFGELTVAPKGQGATVSKDREEQVYFVLAGKGAITYNGVERPLRTEDFLYLGAGSEHTVHNPSSDPLRIIVMGWRLPDGVSAPAPETLPIANTSQAKKQVVGNHPPTTL